MNAGVQVYPDREPVERRTHLEALVAIHRRRRNGAEGRSVLEDATDEVIGQFREAQAARVGVVVKEILAAVRVGEMIMHVGPGARPRRERLGHERRDRADPLGKLAGHHPEDDAAVGRREGVGVPEIDLVLVIRVLMVGLIDTPVELIESVVERAEEPQRPGDALEVIARLGEVVHRVGIPTADRAVALLDHQEELRLDAHIEDKSPLTRPARGCA